MWRVVERSGERWELVLVGRDERREVEDSRERLENRLEEEEVN